MCKVPGTFIHQVCQGTLTLPHPRNPFGDICRYWVISWHGVKCVLLVSRKESSHTAKCPRVSRTALSKSTHNTKVRGPSINCKVLSVC